MEEIRDEIHLQKLLKIIPEDQQERAHELLKSGRKIRVLGYWKGARDYNKHFPHPEEFVDNDWGRDDRQMMINYLNRGACVSAFMGLSFCRFNCGCVAMGALELSDGTYCWPEGLSHYLEKHAVRLPDEFVEHVRNNLNLKLPEDADQDTVMLSIIAPDFTWWNSHIKD